jgi:hypothetical protein
MPIMHVSLYECPEAVNGETKEQSLGPQKNRLDGDL